MKDKTKKSSEDKAPPSSPEARSPLEEAARTRNADAIIEIEFTPGVMISSINTIAAKYASKHALEKWFPEITEPTRTKIRQIIKNAYENVTPFAELIERIQDAGQFPEDRARDIAQTETSQAQVGSN